MQDPAIQAQPAIQGSWSGKVRQQFADKMIEFDLHMHLDQEGHIVSGSSTLDLSGVVMPGAGDFYNQLHIHVKGQIHRSQFLHLSYENEDTDILHFGSIIFEITPHEAKGHLLDGVFVGYGANSHELVKGTAYLYKVNPNNESHA